MLIYQRASSSSKAQVRQRRRGQRFGRSVMERATWRRRWGKATGKSNKDGYYGAPESAKLVQISTICTISGVYDSYIYIYIRHITVYMYI